MLSQAEGDLVIVARDVDEAGDYQTGARIQALQGDVEKRLEWLLESLRDEQRRRKDEEREEQPQEEQGEQPPQEQGEQGPPRLVPDLAELRLLRRLEVEMLAQIDQLRLLHPDLDSGEPNALLLADLARLASRHERLTKIFVEFRTRLGVPAPGAPTEQR
jgi:hypothetical protein